jgi:hypothetical protein
MGLNGQDMLFYDVPSIVPTPRVKLYYVGAQDEIIKPA